MSIQTSLGISNRTLLKETYQLALIIQPLLRTKMGQSLVIRPRIQPLILLVATILIQQSKIRPVIKQATRIRQIPTQQSKIVHQTKPKRIQTLLGIFIWLSDCSSFDLKII